MRKCRVVDLKLGDRVYAVSSNLGMLDLPFDNRYEITSINNGKTVANESDFVTLKEAETPLSALDVWSARSLYIDRMEAICRCEEVIRNLVQNGETYYDHPKTQKFRLYGSGRERIYAEGYRVDLEALEKREQHA